MRVFLTLIHNYFMIVYCLIGIAVVVTYPALAIFAFSIGVVIGVLYHKTIKVKYFAEGLIPLEKITVGDWIDLRASERVELKAGECKLIPLGVGMILPKGYEAHLLPRSSTLKNYGILCGNSMGIIDNSYSGDADEWKFSAVAVRDTVIEKNERICQFRIVQSQPKIWFKTVLKLNNKSRGGFGSTGRA